MSHQEREPTKEIPGPEEEKELRQKVCESREEILRFKRLNALTGIPRSTLYDLMRDGRFPRPISLGGGRTVGWLSSEVDQWIADQAEASRRTA
ncbi:helix-turn-helix transcriptional regulator [Marinobacter changyiensis]|uniref:helix-turn-helix transcriptional regulator n=1 Tax=Marinobacter changyiensis TaxID=2604091 RepID=UPI0012651533|nr:AlpA family phage regulatory protein [Marinobacter changyiensis]